MATPPDISKDRFGAASESSRREMAAKRKVVEETPIPGPGGASSSIASQTFLDQANILQTADELAKSNADVGRILREYAYSLAQEMDPNIEGRGDLQSFIKQKRSCKEGDKIDRSHDVRILQEFYQQYREENHLDQLEHKDYIHRHSDTYDEDSATNEQQTEVQMKICNTARVLNAVIDALTKDGQTHESNSRYVDLHAVREVTFQGVQSSMQGVGHVVVMEKLDAYMKLTKVCLEGIQGMASPKFNEKQCAYLFEKLEAAVESAKSFIEELEGRANEIFSTTAMNRWAETFKLLLVSSERVEGLIRECGKDDWIRSALTLAHVKEHVSSIGLSLEFCKVALRMEQGVAKILTVDEVGKLNETESERVKNMAAVDASSLIDMASAAADSSRMPPNSLRMARCLRGKLRVGVVDPYFDHDGGSQNMSLSDLFKFVNLFNEKQIGVGSSGKVFSVWWLGIPVAKKTFDGSDNDEFWREARVLSRLHHPNVTSVFCCNKNKWECSIIMELMDGSLYDLLRKRRNGEEFYPFSDLEGLDLMLQVGEGVNYLHEEKIVHRDLKSGNILVKMVKATDEKEKYMQVKVADFGLSKTKETSISYSTMTNKVGTSRWMAPEIIRCIEKRESSCASTIKHNFKGDIYSLGMVFWEILVGELPFQSERSEKEVRNMVLENKRPKLPAYCSPRLAKLIERCWSQEPEKRPCIGDVCKELKYLKYLLLTNGFSQECSNQWMGQSCKVKEKKDHEEYALAREYSEAEMVSMHMHERASTNFIKSYYSKVSSTGEEVTIHVIENQEGILNLGKLVDTLSEVHHKNVISLIGYRSMEQKLMLIYEFLNERNSLSNLVCKGDLKKLDWKIRINIGLQVATGLEYLHSRWRQRQCLIHGSVSPGNICINSRNEAKLFGFDLEQLISGVCQPRHELQNEYLDPEYKYTKKLSTKSDVYSFGVMLVELISSYDSDNSSEGVLNRVRSCLLDVEVFSEISPLVSNLDSMKKVLVIALCCLEPLSKHRPSMSEVVVGLRYALELEENPSLRNPTDLATLVRNKNQPMWSTGLFDCFADPGVCIVTSLWWCSAELEIAEALNGGNTSCLTVFCGSSPNRGQVRAKYNIPKGPVPDFVVEFFCVLCNLCQQYREIEYRCISGPEFWGTETITSAPLQQHFVNTNPHY